MSKLREGMVIDLFTPEDKLVNKKQGDFNLMFAKDMGAYVRKYFGDNFNKLEEMDSQMIEKNCRSLNVKADGYVRVKNLDNVSSTYKTKLGNFSSWLSEFDINDYRKKNLILEIPGQYNGDREPMPDFHNKISYFLPETLVI